MISHYQTITQQRSILLMLMSPIMLQLFDSDEKSSQSEKSDSMRFFRFPLLVCREFPKINLCFSFPQNESDKVFLLSARMPRHIHRENTFFPMTRGSSDFLLDFSFSLFSIFPHSSDRHRLSRRPYHCYFCTSYVQSTFVRSPYFLFFRHRAHTYHRRDVVFTVVIVAHLLVMRRVGSARRNACFRN